MPFYLKVHCVVSFKGKVVLELYINKQIPFELSDSNWKEIKFNPEIIDKTEHNTLNVFPRFST